MSSDKMGRGNLPEECFSHNGRLKVRTALRYLYNTYDSVPTDAQLCDLWWEDDDPIRPKRVGRERSSLKIDEGYELETTPGGKRWRVVRRPAPKAGNGHGDPDLFTAEAPGGAPPVEDPDDLLAALDRIVGAHMDRAVDRLIAYWDGPA